MTPRPLPLATPPPRPEPRRTVAGGWSRLWFNLTRTPAALLDLARAIGVLRAARVLSKVVAASLRADPLAALGPPSDEAERLSRRQLRMVLLLDHALRATLDDDAARAALHHVVTRGGARFLRYSLRLPSAARWAALDAGSRRALVERSIRPFFNMQAVPADDPSAQVAFDVQACWFARLTHDLARPDLSPLFCAADSVFFDDPAVAVGLRRDETLASGAPRCGFRLAFKAV